MVSINVFSLYFFFQSCIPPLVLLLISAFSDFVCSLSYSQKVKI